MDVMEDMVSDIERGLNNMMEKEISSSFIGEIVMDKLKDLDEVAYVRFASVYRQFKDVNTFVAEIEKLLGGAAENDRQPAPGSKAGKNGKH
jgi:transcriptional repressor NrdR